MTDFRAELQLLFDAAESFTEPALGHHSQWAAALDRARAALAEQPVGPTDEELWAVGDEDFHANCYPTVAIRYARAVLARWGQP